MSLGVYLPYSVLFLRSVWVEEHCAFGDSECTTVEFVFFSFGFGTIGRKIEIITSWGDLMRELRPGETGLGKCRRKEISILDEFRTEEF